MLLEPAPPNEYPVLRPARALRSAWRRVSAWTFVASHWLRGHSVRRLVPYETPTCWTCGALPVSGNVKPTRWADMTAPPRLASLDDDRPSLPEP